MFNDDFDINSFMTNGYSKTSIIPSMADALLKEVMGDSFSKDEPDEPDYDGYVEKYYRDRFISTKDRFNQEDRSPLQMMVASSVLAFQAPLLRFYPGGRDMDCTNVSAYEGKTGYMMDWHQDIGDRSISESIIYLNPKPWSLGDGGEIQIAKVTRNQFGKVVKRDIVAEIQPRHGDVVTLENLSPHFEHRVLPWNASHSRFSVIVIAGMLHKY